MGSTDGKCLLIGKKPDIFNYFFGVGDLLILSGEFCYEKFSIDRKFLTIFDSLADSLFVGAI